MSFTAEQFNQIVESLRSDSLGKRSYEKRTAPRVGVRTKLEIVPLPGLPPGVPVPPRLPPAAASGPVENVWVRDISADGIGILHASPMDAGARFVAHFLRGQRAPLSVVYAVTHCKTISKTLFTIGAKLERVLEG
jgi:hypothetical protein